LRNRFQGLHGRWGYENDFLEGKRGGKGQAARETMLTDAMWSSELLAGGLGGRRNSRKGTDIKIENCGDGGGEGPGWKVFLFREGEISRAGG